MSREGAREGEPFWGNFREAIASPPQGATREVVATTGREDPHGPGENVKQTPNYEHQEHSETLLSKQIISPLGVIAVLWVIGRHDTASQNFSVIHRLLHFSANLILFFKAQHTERNGKVRPFGDSPSKLSDP
ncbi:hypothetical protein MTR67_002532 [Solanum verrucosum]|uniref:Uncharacterized protein n=1 Tax=Solanum verrucosum TaxID=315347 RepID=A0AAF0PQR5_SOLVR|nr:hypothetical protein MTR67_002532 [Solanum verrucosum]